MRMTSAGLSSKRHQRHVYPEKTVYCLPFGHSNIHACCVIYRHSRVQASKKPEGTQTRCQSRRTIATTSLKVPTIGLRTRVNGAGDHFFIEMSDAVSRGNFYALERVEVSTIHGRRDVGFPFALHFCHVKRMSAARAIEFVTCEAQLRKYIKRIKGYERTGLDG